MIATTKIQESLPMESRTTGRVARRSLRCLGLGLIALLSAGLASAQDAPKRYSKVSVEGASIRNLSDEKGVQVASPKLDSLVAVYGDTTNGWSLVEVPGGFPVYVFGKYLEYTGKDDIYEVTRNAVNIRPGASSDIENYPLPQRLHAGDRVRLIQAVDPSKPLAESWAYIWSPPGVRAYMQATELTSLPVGLNGKALWANALLDVAGAPALPSVTQPKTVTRSVQPVAAAKDQRSQEAWSKELEEARQLMRGESKREQPDVAALRARFNAFLAQSPPAGFAKAAREGLAQIDLLEEASDLVQDVKREREKRRQEILARQSAVIEAARLKDPLGEAFLSRGVLFRRRENDQAARYFLRFGRQTVAEVQCSSGRYNLEQFAGHQVGVQGMHTTMAAAGLGAPAGQEVPVVDISRIEVTQLRR